MWSQTLRRLKNDYVTDCRNLVISFGQLADFSYGLFKNVWQDMKFTLILDAKPEDVEDEPFLQELYRIFLEFFFLKGQPPYVRIGAIFALYTLYKSKKGDPIPIKIDDAVMGELSKASDECIKLSAMDAFFCLRELRVTLHAFMYTAVMVTPGPPSSLPEEDSTPSAPVDWYTTNTLASSILFDPLQVYTQRYEKAKMMVREQAHQLGMEHIPLDDAPKEAPFFQAAAHEIVRYEEIMDTMSLGGISTAEELAQLRMKYRNQARALGQRTQTAAERDEESAMTEERMHPRMQPQQPQEDDDGFISDGESEAEEKKAEEDRAAAEVVNRRRPSAPAEPPQPKAPGAHRGRKSSYLMDFGIINEVNQNRMMMPQAQLTQAPPPGMDMQAAAAPPVMTSDGQPLTPDQMAMMQQMPGMAQSDMLQYQQYQYAAMQQQQAAEYAQQQATTEAPPEVLPPPPDTQQMDVKEED